MKRGWCVAAAAAALLADAQALEVERLDAQYRDKLFELTLVAVIDAPLPRVQTVLRDYARYPTLDARILEASVLERQNENDVVLYTKLRACAGLFCRTVKRIERVHERQDGLDAEVEPERSELTRGATVTRWTIANGRTRVSYTTQLAPKFWIPAFVGRPLMLRTLREASIELFRNVEAQAQAQAPRAAGP